MRDDQHEQVNWDRCRYGSFRGYGSSDACREQPTVIGEWLQGDEAGLLIPWCDEHNDDRIVKMKNVVPWYPNKSAEELMEIFMKELNS